MNHRALHIIFWPYTPATINHLEKWLRQKASMGWRLEEMCGWKFVFRKCKPYETRYCYYSGFGTSIGISYDYLAAKKRYSRVQSAINKSNVAIFEVDINKIDSGFKHFVILRNKFYLKHYFTMLLFAIMCVVMAVYLTLTNSGFAVFLVYGVILLMYSLFSVILLGFEAKR